MKIYLGADHAGFPVKEKLKNFLEERNIPYEDCGTYSEQPVNYPIFAFAVSEKVVADNDSRGILVCGTGQGMCMAAHQVPGIRAAAVYDMETAKLTRKHNDANILCLGARNTSYATIEQILEAWLFTDFEGGRHKDRIDMIANYRKT